MIVAITWWIGALCCGLACWCFCKKVKKCNNTPCVGNDTIHDLPSDGTHFKSRIPFCDVEKYHKKLVKMTKIMSFCAAQM